MAFGIFSLGFSSLYMWVSQHSVHYPNEFSLLAESNWFCIDVLMQKIPIWWRWYYWICPVAWTLYGLGASQFGDVEEKLDTGETVAKFMRSCYGFKHEFLEMVAIVTMACPVAFAFLFGISLKNINFQKRWNCPCKLHNWDCPRKLQNVLWKHDF